MMMTRMKNSPAQAIIICSVVIPIPLFAGFSSTLTLFCSLFSLIYCWSFSICSFSCLIAFVCTTLLASSACAGCGLCTTAALSTHAWILLATSCISFSTYSMILISAFETASSTLYISNFFKSTTC